MNYLEVKSSQSSRSAIYVDEYDQPQTIPAINQIAQCQKRAEKSSIILVEDIYHRSARFSAFNIHFDMKVTC